MRGVRALMEVVISSDLGLYLCLCFMSRYLDTCLRRWVWGNSLPRIKPSAEALAGCHFRYVGPRVIRFLMIGGTLQVFSVYVLRMISVFACVVYSISLHASQLTHYSSIIIVVVVVVMVGIIFDVTFTFTITIIIISSSSSSSTSSSSSSSSSSACFFSPMLEGHSFMFHGIVMPFIWCHSIWQYTNFVQWQHRLTNDFPLAKPLATSSCNGQRLVAAL